ncbi:MAG: riboflavin synthase [Gammaproteobacteria bacterium]
MFTGIIQAVGTMAALEARGGDMALHIRTGDLDMRRVALGDSIATNGVCLTVIELPGDGYVADVSRETLAHTTLGELKPGSPVNLEKALTLDSHLGGHLVSGHVDGVGRILERRDDGRSVRFRIEAPAELARYIAHNQIARYLERLLLGDRVDGATATSGVTAELLARNGFLR